MCPTEQGEQERSGARWLLTQGTMTMSAIALTRWNVLGNEPKLSAMKESDLILPRSYPSEFSPGHQGPNEVLCNRRKGLCIWTCQDCHTHYGCGTRSDGGLQKAATASFLQGRLLPLQLGLNRVSTFNLSRHKVCVQTRNVDKHSPLPSWPQAVNHPRGRGTPKHQESRAL